MADVFSAVSTTLAAGLIPQVDFIFGLPGETLDDMQCSIATIRELAAMGALIHAHTFMPLPQTGYAKEPAGRIHGRLRVIIKELIRKGSLHGIWHKQGVWPSESPLPQDGEIKGVSIAQASPTYRGLDPGMLRGNEFLLARHDLQWHRFDSVSSRAIITPATSTEIFGTTGPQASCQQAVGGRRGAAALQVAEDRQSRLLPGESFKLLGQTQGVLKMFSVELVEPLGDLAFLGLRCGRFFFLEHVVDGLGVFDRHGPFGHRDDAEPFSGPRTVANRIGDPFELVGNLGNQDHVGPAGDSGPQGQPAGPVAHHLDHDNPVVAGGRRMEAVDGFGGNL